MDCDKNVTVLLFLVYDAERMKRIYQNRQRLFYSTGFGLSKNITIVLSFSLRKKQTCF